MVFSIEVHGERLVTRQGRDDGALRERAIACRDADAARRRCATVVRQRLAEGWQPVGSRRRRRREVQRAPALEAALARDPHDEAARHVYADWLLSRGDPLGELILAEREWERTQEPRLLGRVGRLRHACTANLADRRDIKLVWHSGTVHRLVVRNPGSVIRDLASILDRTALRTVGVVEIHTPVMGPSSTPQRVVDLLGAHGPPGLHTVDLVHLRRPASPPRLLVQLEPLTALPAFEEVGLDLAAGHRVHLPRERLRRFRLVIRHPSFVDRLGAQSWPRLEHLVLRGTGEHRVETDLLATLGRLRAPALRTLELRRLTLPHRALCRLLDSRVGRRLTAIDVSGSTVDLPALRRLASRDPRVRRVLRRNREPVVISG